MLDFIMLVNRQGKVRLCRWYHPGLTIKHRQRITVDLPAALLIRNRSLRSLCNTFAIPAAYRPSVSHARIVYRRYASLFFAFALAPAANLLLAMDLIHRLVETLDQYFGSVCELDLVYNFHKTAYVVDEMFVGGLVGETSAAQVLEGVRGADAQEKEEKEEARRATKMFQM